MAVAAPLHAALFDDDEARRQVAAERKRIDELRMQQQAIETRIGKMEDGLKNQPTLNQPVLDLFTQLEAIRLELNRLRGQVEVVHNNVENTAKRQRDMYVDLDTRMRRLEQSASAPPTPAAISPPAAAPATPTSPPAGTKPQASGSVGPGSVAAPSVGVGTLATSLEASSEVRSYEAAQAQRRAGNYQGAIVAFQNFIKQYPKSSLAPRAQYWIGDSYFNLQDYKLSIASQQVLLKSYPDSPTIPDAMLNIASSQIEMGEGSAGKRTLEELIAKFPISEAADKAKRRLVTPSAR